MADELHWERSNYESRIDRMAGEISSFVKAVLGSIDEDAARASSEQWTAVCRFFRGCASAARVQGNTPEGGGQRIAVYLTRAFPLGAGESQDGFFEFMDWLSNPDAFQPTRLYVFLNQG